MADLILQIAEFLLQDMSIELAEKAIYPAIEELNRVYCDSLKNKKDYIEIPRVEYVVRDPEYGDPISFARLFSCLHTLRVHNNKHIDLIKKFRMFNKRIKWINIFDFHKDDTDRSKIFYTVRNSMISSKQQNLNIQGPVEHFSKNMGDIYMAPNNFHLDLFDKMGCYSYLSILGEEPKFIIYLDLLSEQHLDKLGRRKA